MDRKVRRFLGFRGTSPRKGDSKPAEPEIVLESTTDSPKTITELRATAKPTENPKPNHQTLVLKPDGSFPYQPLNESLEGSLRLLSLHPGSRGEVPVCTLMHNTWGPHGLPYEALSYAWGDTSERRSIFLNGLPFLVTTNLYSALTQLRYDEGPPRTLWVDAICIDQHNVLERNHQVGSMGSIYENCRQVLVWLGDADEESDNAMQFIEAACEELARQGVRWGGRADLERLWNDTIKMDVLGKLFLPGLEYSWIAVCRLLQREWWRRAWVFQEFVSAPKATFHVGDSSLDWAMLYVMVRIMFCAPKMEVLLRISIPDSASTMTDANDMVYARLMGANGSSRFVYLLHCQRPRQCGDPRDKVYSILTMTNSALRQALQPDYSKSVQWTYIQAVKAHIKVYQNLEILCYSMHGTSSSIYPSWCPDWEKPQNRSILGAGLQDIYYKASGRWPASAGFSDDENTTIWLKGFRIDSVSNAQLHSSTRGFSWRNSSDVGPKCNWDIQAMAMEVVERSIKSEDSDEENAEMLAEFEFLKAAQGLAFKDIVNTLVAGYYTTSTSATREVPALAEDPIRSEWWPEDKAEYFRQVYQRSWGRTVILSEGCRVGLAPEQTQVGDEIFVFRGCITPVVLREREDGAYTWVGDMYLDGVMKGEAMTGLEEGLFCEEAIGIR